eukprot:1953994-Alexandrium_andersonii.AAC.1
MEPPRAPAGRGARGAADFGEPAPPPRAPAVPPPVGPGRNETDIFVEISLACGILGTPDDG